MKQHTPKTSAGNLSRLNQQFELASAEDIIRWSADYFANRLVLVTTLGIESAVVLHLVSRNAPKVPIIFINTGFLPKETLGFAAALERRLGVSIYCYAPEIGPPEVEHILGADGRFNRPGRFHELTKGEPTKRALSDFDAVAYFSGTRRVQTRAENQTQRVVDESGIVKIAPIFDWTSRDIHRYLLQNELPYHPLWEREVDTVSKTAQLTSDFGTYRAA